MESLKAMLSLLLDKLQVNKFNLNESEILNLPFQSVENCCEFIPANHAVETQNIYSANLSASSGIEIHE